MSGKRNGGIIIMWAEEEYGGLYEDPPDVNIIIQEARDKLYEALTESVRTSMADAREAERRFAELKFEINAAEYQLNSLKSEIADKEAEIEKIDRYRLPRGFANKIVDALTGGFAPGDKAWRVSGEQRKVECPVCSGNKKLKVMSGDKKFEINCPSCSGNGTVTRFFLQPEGATIKEITVKLTISSDRVDTWSNETIDVYEDSGSYRADRFYKTLEECQAECDRLNARQSEN